MSALQTMVKCMARETFYVSGTIVNEKQGLHAGWTCHQGSFSDCLPVWNENRDICLIFSGEHFDDPEERVALRRRGHCFHGNNASCLVHLYEEQGIEFLEKLNGWFSGVLVDNREGKVVLFNDRYGMGRIYVHENPQGVYFSSEAKSLLRVLPTTRQLDPVGLAEFGSCGCALENRTIFSGISLLPPASRWTFTLGKLARKDIYFDRATWESQTTLNDGEYYEELKSTFARILPTYLRGKNAIGMSLTGGLDGRMIMAWGAGSRPGILPCYTFGGTYRDCTDVTIAREVARLCKQSHETIPVDGNFLKDFGLFAERAIYISDGAMDVTGSVELYANQQAREIAPVRLTGNYGSEILRGNVAFKPQLLSSAVYDTELVRLGERAAATYSREAQCHPLSFIAFKQVPWHHYSRLSVEQSQLTLRAPYLDNELVRLAYRASREQLISKVPSLRLIAEGNPSLSRLPTDRGLLYQANPILTKARHFYQEFTFKAEYAYDYGMPQWLSRVDHALAPLRLQDLFLGRHKFYHFRVWYRDQLSKYIAEILLDPHTLGRPFFQRAQLEALVKDHVQNGRNRTSELHQALTLELIQRQLIDPS